jgi:uncharacterized protein (DUF433 family)
MLLRMGAAVDIYGGQNPLDVALYSITQAATYVRVPRATVRSWVLGRDYAVAEGTKFFEPVIRAADPPRLSFRNLLEIHVLRALREVQEIELPHIRHAVLLMEKGLGIEHPLTDQRMRAHGKELFVEYLGNLISLRDGQLLLRSLDEHVKRIDWDNGQPLRLFPFPHTGTDRPLVADPRIRFGRLCLVGTSIPVEELQERSKAGESVADIAKDYGQEVESVRRAIAA